LMVVSKMGSMEGVFVGFGRVCITGGECSVMKVYKIVSAVF
jgi:hypothetical protein